MTYDKLNSQRQEKIAACLIDLLIEDWDDDGAWVGESSVQSKVENDFGFRPTEQELKDVVNFINSKIGVRTVDREMNDKGFSASMVFKASRGSRELKILKSTFSF